MRRRLEQKRARYAVNKEAIRAQRAEHRKANKEHFIALGRANYAKNRESLLKKQRERRKANPERTKADSRKQYLKNPKSATQWRAKNPAKWRARCRAYYAKNVVKLRAVMRASAKKHAAQRRAYRKAHPEYSRASCHSRRAKKYGSPLSDRKAITQWERAWRKKKKVRCNWCGGSFSPKDCHTDHVTPLKVGEHSLRNVCISCAPCNLKKKDKLIEEWNTHLEQPVLL